MSESLAAAERFAAEVHRTGAAAPLCDRAVWAYLSALGAPTEAARAGFYRCVYAAVRDATARGSASPGALAPLLALLDDDFGAVLFAGPERERLWDAAVEERPREASLPS